MTSIFTVERGLNYQLIDVCSDCDFAAAYDFRAAFLSVDDQNAQHTIVDLTTCNFIDSTGLGVLVTQHRDKRNLIVVLPPEHRLERIFELTGLNEYLSIVPTRETALEITRSGTILSKMSSNVMANQQAAGAA